MKSTSNASDNGILIRPMCEADIDIIAIDRCPSGFIKNIGKWA